MLASTRMRVCIATRLSMYHHRLSRQTPTFSSRPLSERGYHHHVLEVNAGGALRPGGHHHRSSCILSQQLNAPGPAPRQVPVATNSAVAALLVTSKVLHGTSGGLGQEEATLLASTKRNWPIDGQMNAKHGIRTQCPAVMC